MPSRDYYVNLRQRYAPTRASLILIAESPPASGKYFYDPSGRVSEPLFRALTVDLLNISPTTKDEGLRHFQSQGCILLDATYTPVNKNMSQRLRKETILADYPTLIDELTKWSVARETPILLIKCNVCRLLEPKLILDGYRILNDGVAIPFPSNGQQGNFRRTIRSLMDGLKTHFHRSRYPAK